MNSSFISANIVVQSELFWFEVFNNVNELIKVSLLVYIPDF